MRYGHDIVSNIPKEEANLAPTIQTNSKLQFGRVFDGIKLSDGEGCKQSVHLLLIRFWRIRIGGSILTPPIASWRAARGLGNVIV